MTGRHLIGARRSAVCVATFAVVAVTAAACGGSSSGGHPGAGTSPQARIRADWTAFFNANTPLSRREQLLQNGTRFASLLRAQSSSPLAASSAATVNSVHLTGSSSATVRYTITLGGKPALANQTGEAVLQGGVWKVADATFCGLLALQRQGNPGRGCPTSAPMTSSSP